MGSPQGIYIAHSNSTESTHERASFVYYYLANKTNRLPAGIVCVAADEVSESVGLEHGAEAAGTHLLDVTSQNSRRRQSRKRLSLGSLVAVHPGDSRADHGHHCALGVEHCIEDDLLVRREGSAHRELHTGHHKQHTVTIIAITDSTKRSILLIASLSPLPVTYRASNVRHVAVVVSPHVQQRHVSGEQLFVVGGAGVTVVQRRTVGSTGTD
jgi:hypothetical protein